MLNDLRERVESFITTTGDRGGLPAAATEPSLAEIQKAKRADYERTWKARLKKPDPDDAEKLLWWEKSYGIASDDSLP